MTPTTLAAALAAALALAAAAPAAAAGAVDFPTLKSGQWEMTTTRRRGQPAAHRDDVPRRHDAEGDDRHGRGHAEGDVHAERHAPRRLEFITDAECKFGDSVIKSHGVMTITGDTAYHTETSATFDPPLTRTWRVEDGHRRQVHRPLPRRPAARRHGHRQRQKININQIPPRPPAPSSVAALRREPASPNRRKE